VFSVRQSLVTGVEVTETYPYDSATFKGATAEDATATAAGFNAGADLFWMFSRHVGAGRSDPGLARARASAHGRGPHRVSRCRRVQAGGGLRLMF
jgi:hypothetical protein